MSRSTRCRRLAVLSLLVPTALASAIANAQQAGDQAHALDGVTVIAQRATTATKTDTPLTETPQSVSVVT